MKNGILPRVMAIVFAAALTIRQLYYMFTGGSLSVWQVLWLITYAGILIGAAIGNKKLTAGVVAAGAIVSVTGNIMDIMDWGFSFDYVLAVLPWLLLAVVVLIGSGKNATPAKSLWFVPFAAYVVRAAVSYGSTLFWYIQDGWWYPEVFRLVLMCILYAGMFAFVAYWVCCESTPLATKETTAQKQAKHGSSPERLMELKKLLDAGIITQEEFEEKKKDILGE